MKPEIRELIAKYGEESLIADLKELEAERKMNMISFYISGTEYFIDAREDVEAQLKPISEEKNCPMEQLREYFETAKEVQFAWMQRAEA